MMATNVTEKDKTLNEIITWCEQHSKDACSISVFWGSNGYAEQAAWHDGRATALDDIAAHCKALLGYGGSMPLEVPNQSEDAK